MSIDLPNRQASAPARIGVPKNFDTVRAIACILLVSYHVVGWPPERGLHLPPDSMWHVAMNSLDFIRMPTFTILSGYLYGCSRVTAGTLQSVSLKRLRRLGLPLVFCTCVLLLLRSAFRDEDRSLLFALTHSYEHLWFLQALLIIFTLIALWDAFASPSLKALIIACAGASFLSASGLVTSDVFSVGAATYLLPFFLFGIILREQPKLLSDARTAWTAAGIAAVVLSVQQLGFAGLVPLLKRTDLLATLCGMSAVIVLIHTIPASPLLAPVGQQSYTIYLWHTASASVARACLLAIGVTSIPVLFVLCLAVGLAVPIALGAIVSRWDWAAYLFMGSRGNRREAPVPGPRPVQPVEARRPSEPLRPVRAISLPQKKWGPALLPAPTAPSEGSAGLRGPDPRGPFPKVLAHQLRRRFPSNNSLVRGASTIYLTAPPEGSLVFQLSSPGPRTKTVRCSAALLGSTTLASRFVLPPEGFWNRVALEEDQLFRRLFPTGPANLRRASHCLSAEIGPSVACRFLPAVAGFPVEAGTSVPITLATCTSRPSRKREKCGNRPVDNGDIGNNRKNIPESPRLLLIRSRG